MRASYLNLDADEIDTNLYQGSKPPEGSILRRLGFDAVALCARTYQPSSSRFPGVDVIHAPNSDDCSQTPHREPTRQELTIAVAAARRVVRHLREGKRVLVTCQAGLNRSGLVSALALHFHHGWDGRECIARVQARRQDALFNEGFVAVLRRLKSLQIEP